MKMKTKIGVITAASVLALALGVASFRSSSKTRSASAINVSLQDVSGKPLSSLFDGMPIDKRYPEFKRLVAERHSSTCGQQPSQASRLLRELGLWFEPVVHACNICNNCGFIPGGRTDEVCSTDCGFYELHRDLKRVPQTEGFKNGTLICTGEPPPTCPVKYDWANCNCPLP